MNSRKDIQTELKLWNSRLPLDAKMPVFDLPEGYFENFASRMLAAVKDSAAAEETAELSPLLAGLSKQMPFAVPQGYFTAPVAPPAEEVLPGWMHAARTNPYTVPQGYFENFAAQVLDEVAPRGAKVIQMLPRRWMRYAAAAAVAGALVFGGLRYQTDKPLNPATAPEEWVAKKLNGVSNQELEAFILATEVTGTETAKQAGSSKTEVQKLLTDVPNDELDAFLASLPTGSELIN